MRVGDGELASHAHGKLLPRKGRSLKTALGLSKSLKGVEDPIQSCRNARKFSRIQIIRILMHSWECRPQEMVYVK